jgi:hypothetical protein
MCAVSTLNIIHMSKNIYIFPKKRHNAERERNGLKIKAFESVAGSSKCKEQSVDATKYVAAGCSALAYSADTADN